MRAVDRLGPTAGIMVAAVALTASVLVPLGWWRPLVVAPLVVVAAVASWWLTRGLGPSPDSPGPPWRRRLVPFLVLGFTAWSAVLHSGHVVIRRDGGAYALYTQWIATHHGLPVTADLAAFGGGAAFGVTRFTLSSPAFYQVLSTGPGGVPGPGTQAEIVPQFLVGAPAVYSLGWWTGAPFGASWTGMQLLPAVVTGLALLCLAALVARLVGPAWAPLAVAGLGLALPIVLTSRTTYSEPVALLMLLAAAVIVVDALRGRRRDLALLGGALTGLTGLVRVDSVREVALLVAVCAVLAMRGNRVAVPLGASALAGSGLSLLVGWTMSRPYLTSIGPSLRPLLAGTAALVVVSAVAVAIARRRAAGARREREPGSPRAGAPGSRLAVTAVLLLGVVLVSRPLWMTARQDPTDPGSLFVASLQRGQGLPVDGGRTYAEQTMQWLAWYLGWPAVTGAWVVLAVLAGRAVGWWRSGSADPPAWLVPAAVAMASTVLVLLRPGITPDHPWAARRLVPVALPVMAVAAVAAVAWATRRLPRSHGPFTAPRVAAVGSVLLLVPVAWGTAPMAVTRTEAGEPAAVERVCAALRPGDAVAAVDATADGTAQRSANEWVQVVRGVCGHPSAALLTPADALPEAAATLADLVAGAGHRLVLLTAQEDGDAARRVLARAGAPTDSPLEGSRFEAPRRAVRAVTREDHKVLAGPPTGSKGLAIEVWLAPAVSSGAAPAGPPAG